MIHTLVIGASENTERYSNKAIRSLLAHQHSIVAVGARKGEVNGIAIYRTLEEALNSNSKKIDTVTLYINPTLQSSYIEDIIGIKPRRVIFNPGTENPEFYIRLRENGIEAVEACTLVLLVTGQF